MSVRHGTPHSVARERANWRAFPLARFHASTFVTLVLLPSPDVFVPSLSYSAWPRGRRCRSRFGRGRYRRLGRPCAAGSASCSAGTARWSATPRGGGSAAGCAAPSACASWECRRPLDTKRTALRVGAQARGAHPPARCRLPPPSLHRSEVRVVEGAESELLKAPLDAFRFTGTLSPALLSRQPSQTRP
ncbi:MAG: hypothetical protein G01um101438_1062 [Parcubacteria group bacterium Gr01-1014_38]|nr:MAG: hypothetical protein G01um101438_1062 [Parcubacteria group bacterium Gr01-1014_38]